MLTPNLSRRAALLLLALVLFGLLLPLWRPAAAQSGSRVEVLTISDEIDLWVAGYVDRGISRAEGSGAQAVVIVLQTPGGVVQPTLDIMQRLANSRVPVIAYIPTGAHSASGGAYIAIASNLIAMAPSTVIGACHPVGDSGQNLDTDIRAKETNLLASKMRTFALQRGHNADWAEQCVRTSITLGEKEALDQNVAQVIAPDLANLLSQVDGRTVQTAAGDVTLHTRGAQIEPDDPNFVEQFFHFLLNPNIALILLAAGQLAIVVELYHPGATVPAVVGVICLVLAATALYGLPTNWAAVILVSAAMVMFVLDIKFTSVVLTIGGIFAFVLGALLLFRPFNPPVVPTAPDTSVSPFVIAGLALGLTGFFLVILRAAYQSRFAPVVTGQQGMLGLTGFARQDLDPSGAVHVRSEDWSAEAIGGPITRGDRVQVVGVHGIRLQVKKI